jgi:hypothetical protein
MTSVSRLRCPGWIRDHCVGPPMLPIALTPPTQDTARVALLEATEPQTPEASSTFTIAGSEQFASRPRRRLKTRNER